MEGNLGGGERDPKEGEKGKHSQKIMRQMMKHDEYLQPRRKTGNKESRKKKIYRERGGHAGEDAD